MIESSQFSAERGHSIIGHGEHALPVLLQLLRDLRLDMHGILIDSQGAFSRRFPSTSDSLQRSIEIIRPPRLVMDAGQGHYVLSDVTRSCYEKVFSQVWLAFVLVDDLTEQEFFCTCEIVRMIKAEGGMVVGLSAGVYDSNDSFEADGHGRAFLLRELDFLLQMPSHMTSVYDEPVTYLADALASIAYPLQGKGFIGIDLSDVRDVMTLSRNMTCGVGTAAGHDRVDCATAEALGSLPQGSKILLHARGVFVSVKGGEDFSLQQFSRIADLVEELVSKESSVLIGTHTNPNFHGQLSVFVYVII